MEYTPELYEEVYCGTMFFFHTPLLRSDRVACFSLEARNQFITSYTVRTWLVNSIINLADECILDRFPESEKIKLTSEDYKFGWWSSSTNITSEGPGGKPKVINPDEAVTGAVVDSLDIGPSMVLMFTLVLGLKPLADQLDNVVPLANLRSSSLLLTINRLSDGQGIRHHRQPRSSISSGRRIYARRSISFAMKTRTMTTSSTRISPRTLTSVLTRPLWIEPNSPNSCNLWQKWKLHLYVCRILIFETWAMVWTEPQSSRPRCGWTFHSGYKNRLVYFLIQLGDGRLNPGECGD